jgi:hypothetical protein
MRRASLCLLAAVSLASTATIAFAQVDYSKPGAGTPPNNVQVAEGGNTVLEEYRINAASKGKGDGNPGRNGSPPKNPAVIEVEETVHYCVVDNCW